MNDTKALEIVNKIFKSVFDKQNNYSLDVLLEKFAFDVKLPKQVNDSTTNEITWADYINSVRFITNKNMEKRDEENRKYYYVAKINLTTGGNYGYSFRVMPQNEMLLDSENMDLVKWIEK